MSLAMFQSTSIPVLEQVVQFVQSRHALLASNVANMDTPGYRVRDLSPAQFQEALAQAIKSRDKARQGEAIGSQIFSTRKADPMRQVDEAMKGILYHDNSDVSLEQQVSELNKNQMMHDMAITILRAQYDLLTAAVAERV